MTILKRIVGIEIVCSIMAVIGMNGTGDSFFLCLGYANLTLLFLFVVAWLLVS